MSPFGLRSVLAITLAIFMTGTLNPVLGADSPNNGSVVHDGHFSPDMWSWESNDDGEAYPVFEGTRNVAEPGQPIIPMQELMLLIPVGQQIAQAWVEPINTRVEKLSSFLPVAGPYITDEGESLNTTRLQPENGIFPAQWGEFTGTHTWRGYNILTLNVFPARVSESANGNDIEYLEDFTVKVVYADGSNGQVVVQRERLIPGEKEANAEVLRQMIHNPEAVSGYGRYHGVAVEPDKGVHSPTRTPSLSGSPVQYLIITSEILKEEFERLAQYKTKLGMPSLVVTREFIAANYRNGADIQETIRLFIQDSYSKWGTEYVLLGGDTDIIPTRYVDNSFYPPGSSTMVPVDLYFACLDGNWNANGNAHYGEADVQADGFGDAVDFADEVFLGRAPVSTAVAAGVFVDKVISYETTPVGSDWTNRILYASEVLFPADYEPGGPIYLDGAQFSHQMITDLVEPCTDLEYLRMYEADDEFPRDLPLTKASLIDSLNTGHYGTLNQIGHGYFTVMSVGDALFNTTDADALTNGDNLFMLYSLNCASAAFDLSCLMERFLQNPNGGSIISIGSSRAAFPFAVNDYQQSFFELLYCTEKSRVGMITARSRLPYIGNTVNNFVDRWTFENYTLLGDPTVPIWTSSVEATRVITDNLNLGPNQFSVSIEKQNGSPAGNALVCLSREDGNIVSGHTDANGLVTLDYLVDSPGEINLKITGHNIGQVESTLQVIPDAAYLGLSQFVEVDNGSSGSIGNGNGSIESGELVIIVPLLQETGGGSLTGLVGTLTTVTEGVTILSGPTAFTDVQAGGLSFPQVPILVQFDESMADGTPVDCRLSLSNTTDEIFEVEWTTVVKAPEVEVVQIDWEDTTYGNGDGVMDIDERVVVSARFKNFGSGLADELDIMLRSLDSNVSLYDFVGELSSLEFMATSADVSTFSMSLSDPTLPSISTLEFTDNYGRVQEHDFYLLRPTPPTTFTTNTTLGPDVIALLWEPIADENVFGYNILRSDSPTGPFQRVNTDVVAGTSYYRDEGLSQLTKYYYQVQSLAYPLVPSNVSETIGESTAPALMPGFPIQFFSETSGHLAVGDIDGDNYPEIILGSDEVYAWNFDGTELIDGDNDSQTLGPITGLNSIFQPAGMVLAQMDDQPGLEMIVSDRGTIAQIYVFSHDGSVLPGWPQSTNFGSGTKWSWATPAVGDVDGDGDMEIVVNTLNGRTWAWHHDGTELLDGDNDPATSGVFLVRPGATGEWGVGSPCLYDLDGDGAKDIIFPAGADNLGGNRIEALKYDGTSIPGWPYTGIGKVNNSPAMADLNHDGFIEIAFYDYGANLHVVQQDGTPYSGFPVNFYPSTMAGTGPGVAFGDLDEDGRLEIIFAGNIDGDLSRMVCIDTDIEGGTSGQILDGWPIDFPGSTEGSPVVGDVDGDSVVDILYGIGGGDETTPNNLYGLKASGERIDGFPITLDAALTPSPVICDMDLDGDVDIVYGGWGRKLYVWDMPFAYDVANMPWPTFHGNMQRDGVFDISLLSPVEEVSILPAATFMMEAPYPNPFNPSTSIRLHIPVVNGSSDLELVVFDLQGRKVRTLHNGAISSGWHTLVWDGRDGSGRNQSSGMYFMRAVSGGQSNIHKMTLVK